MALSGRANCHCNVNRVGFFSCLCWKMNRNSWLLCICVAPHFIQSFWHAPGRPYIVFTCCKEVLLSAPSPPPVLWFIIRVGYYLQEDDCFAAHKHKKLYLGGVEPTRILAVLWFMEVITICQGKSQAQTVCRLITFSNIGVLQCRSPLVVICAFLTEKLWIMCSCHRSGPSNAETNPSGSYSTGSHV